MLKLGLTGGIASGKSTVAAMLREMGFRVLDADSLAHSLTEPGQPAYPEIVREFGDTILDSDRRINRSELAAIVFTDAAKLSRLNAIVHPRVEQAITQQLAEWEHITSSPAVFVEAALLIEAGYEEKLDGMVVAWCTPDQQLQRLLARGYREEDARHRIAAQMPAAEKLLHATTRIDCSGSLGGTRHQVQALAASLSQRHIYPTTS
jgi:dephospho-CoA kinase